MQALQNYSSGTGRSYVFFGGASMNNTADVTMTGDTTNNYFGISVSSAGDVNCDGYSDVIVGAVGYFYNTGRAYLYFGGVSMNNIADLTMTGETTTSGFGSSVSSAGDMNGDGYTDMIVGASGYSSGTGRVYLYDYFMKNEIIRDLSMTGVFPSRFLGASVSSAGDVNGDGYSDVIAGAYGFSSNRGRALVYFGGVSMNNTEDVAMGGSLGDYLGASVSSAGDVNGDGYTDVIVGSYGYSSNRGRASVYFGGVSMNNTADVTMIGEEIGSYFGNSVSSAGDVNGDGYSDVIVGAYRFNTISTGRAYVYFGGSSMDTTADLKMTGNTGGDIFGYSVSSAGDVNGDGYSDVIVGANGYSSQTGRTFVFLGGTTMDSTADVIMTGEATGNQFGTSVSSAGDVNGDGYSDVIIGAGNYSSTTGRAYIFFGGLTMDAGADVTMTGETINNYFGSSVSSAGDVNGDGYSDAIVGAFGNSSGTGRAYVYLGSGSMNNTADITMTGEGTFNSLGYSVSSAGDVNGDGYSDLINGEPGYSSDMGRANIYLGSAISVKPVLLAARDVPDDQGGFLNLKFAKSSLDVPVSEAGGISYQIDRSLPPNGNGYQWISVVNISGTYESFYTAEIHTPYDSGTSGNNTYFFRVTAVSNSSGKFWRSNILSGYSLDNIAPPVVSPFTASAAGSNVNLNWGNNSA
ncbi:MAG: FG-GAP repeat protein [Ignavibacteria bacterium]|nr:FG-GAP repeat protein [Ignavibacteria bacterium]